MEFERTLNRHAAGQGNQCWTQVPTVNSFPASIFKLNNGLTVVHQFIPATPVAVVDIWVRAGAATEPRDWGGMAHFLEHIIFKGTSRLAPGVFDWMVENQGGITNAATSHDYAHFFITAAAQTLDWTLPPLAELLINAAIPEAEFVRERNVVLEEIRQASDSPDWQGYQSLMETTYPHHPYGRPILGTQSQLIQRSPWEMRAFHRVHYQPENMTLVVVGGVEQEQALNLVQRHFCDFPAACGEPALPADGGSAYLPAPASWKAKPSVPAIRRCSLDLPRLEQARLMMAWTGPGVEQLESAYGLEVLAVLLGQGRTSRLVRDLREQRGMVHDIMSSCLLQRQSSLLTICAWLDPQDLEQVEALICEHLRALSTTPITNLELDRCKRLLGNSYAFSTEAPGQLAGLYGYYSVIAQADIAVAYPEVVQKFTPESLQALACRYLTPDRYAITLLKPN